ADAPDHHPRLSLMTLLLSPTLPGYLRCPLPGRVRSMDCSRGLHHRQVEGLVELLERERLRDDAFESVLFEIRHDRILGVAARDDGGDGRVQCAEQLDRLPT